MKISKDEPGWLSRYSDSLRAGKSGDRIPVGARFSAPIQPAPTPTQPPVQLAPGLSRGKGGRGRGVNHPPPSSAPKFTKKSRVISLISLRSLHGL